MLGSLFLDLFAIGPIILPGFWVVFKIIRLKINEGWWQFTLFVTYPFDRTFSPSVQYLPVTREAPWGGLRISPVQYLQGVIPHHNYSIDSDLWPVSFKAHIKPTIRVSVSLVFVSLYLNTNSCCL